MVIEMSKKTKIAFAVVIIIAIVIAAAVIVIQKSDRNSKAVETDGTLMENSYQNITYEGKNYVYNSKATAILYAGLDSAGDIETYNRYTIAPRADTIEVFILDDYHKTIKILAVSRDTIAEISRYTMNGTYRDEYMSQIGYAFAFGDGGKVSCNNLKSAVSNLLGGIPVKEHVITNTDTLKDINRIAGGVTVTVPNNDLAASYPELAEGRTVTLDDSNVDAFVRYRDTDAEFSNNGRMERQRAFSESFMKAFKESVSNDAEGTWSKIEEIKENMLTSITRSQHLDLADKIAEADFPADNYYTIEGEDIRGEETDEFHVDKEKLQKLIIDLFYIEDGEA